MAEETASTYAHQVEKRVQKLQKQVDDLRQENSSLKAELLECSNLRIQVHPPPLHSSAIARRPSRSHALSQQFSIHSSRLLYVKTHSRHLTFWGWGTDSFQLYFFSKHQNFEVCHPLVESCKTAHSYDTLMKRTPL